MNNKDSLNEPLEFIENLMSKYGEKTTGKYIEKCMCGGTIHIVVKQGSMLGGSPFINGKCNKCDIFIIT